LSERKELSFLEGRTLGKARKLLIDEIAEVLRETKSAAEELIDQALKARKEAMISNLSDNHAPAETSAGGGVDY
jgi:hypothetical protein